MKSDIPQRDFSTTQWSIVLEAGRTDISRAAAALEHLCRRYWLPIHTFIRRKGMDKQEAEDLTQSFFAHLLEKETLKKVDQQKGKFRSFLLCSLNNFLANDWDKRQAVKRGGRCEIVSLDATLADDQFEPAESLSPEKLFERQWAHALVDHVFSRLKQEYVLAGKEMVLNLLEPALAQEVTSGMYQSWAATLGMTEGAVRVALHRLRRRFGELLRSEIAHTVTTPEEVEDEIRHLFKALTAS